MHCEDYKIREDNINHGSKLKSATVIAVVSNNTEVVIIINDRMKWPCYCFYSYRHLQQIISNIQLGLNLIMQPKISGKQPDSLASSGFAL
uniref:Uncharacterized protein n=1 Tax=Onchocerca volvulus TaxID=6282 RepID=A0A8R1TJV1_ONCVO